MDDLTEFIKAGLDETQAFAEAQLEGLPDEYVGDVTPAQALAAQVLADVTAKRAIVALHQPTPDPKYGSPDPRCLACLTRRDGWREDWKADPWPCETMRQLASAWSEHPDYRPEWSPES